MDKYENEKKNKKMEEIVNKYKNKPRLYKKLYSLQSQLMGRNSVNPTVYKELADLTSLINFGCNFKNGKCRADRTEMCCCGSCASCFGHFTETFFSGYDNIEYIEEEMLYYVREYRAKTGFWRKGKGCILPRHKRSATCLTYNCSSRLTPEEKLLIGILRDRNKFPSYINEVKKILIDYFLYRDK